MRTFPPLTDYISAEDYAALLNPADKVRLAFAVARAMEAICPWPCIKVRNDWWFTTEGSLVANCQWLFYESEAVELDEVAKLFNITRPGVAGMISRGVLQAYRLPDEKLRERPINGRSGQPENPWYVRRSQLEALHG